MNNLSIVVIIKNRTRVPVTAGNERKHIVLRLFENNLDALFRFVGPKDNWELVVIDFGSTDVDMKQFLEGKFAGSKNFVFKLHTLKEPFCKGKGLNIAKTLVSHDTVLFLDADMIITARTLIDNGLEHVSRHKVYFPICKSFTDYTHSKSWDRETGTGNLMISREHLQLYRWIEYNRWGSEDVDFYKHFSTENLAVRDNAGGSFFHQWHPDDYAFKNQYHSHLPVGVSEPELSAKQKLAAGRKAKLEAAKAKAKAKAINK